MGTNDETGEAFNHVVGEAGELTDNKASCVAKSLRYSARSALMVLMTLSSMGCVKNVAMRFVDAANGQPLDGVQGRCHSYSLTWMDNYWENRDLPPSGPNGDLIAKTLRTDSSHALRFYKQGYEDAYVDFGRHVTLTSMASYVSDTELKAWDVDCAVQTHRGPIVVPMYRGTTTRPVPWADHWFWARGERSVMLRAVDVDSQRPLAAVKVRCVANSTRGEIHLCVDVGSTAENGNLYLGPHDADYAYSLTFSKSGYLDANVIWCPLEREDISILSPTGVWLGLASLDQVVVVSMYRAGTSTQPAFMPDGAVQEKNGANGAKKEDADGHE